jgi:excinuclease ABC subunit A
MFSFNSPYGACPGCDGLGSRMDFDPERVVPDPDLSIVEGAIAPYGTRVDSPWLGAQFKALAKAYKIELDTPWGELPARARKILLHGAKGKELDVNYKDSRFQMTFKKRWRGILPDLMRRYRNTKSENVRGQLQQYMGVAACPTCSGARLKPESLAVRVHGKNIHDVVGLSVRSVFDWMTGVRLTAKEKQIAQAVFAEIGQRLQFMMDVGLEYLTLDRSAATLSGGEAQRIRLATQIGSRLMGVLYVLDEPSIGLHQRDNRRLLATLQSLRDLGNTVLVVEHDIDTMWAADFLVDLGPGAGKRGGEVVVADSPGRVAEHATSLTGRYLSGREAVAVPSSRRPGNGNVLTVRGARENNLRKVDVGFPLGCFVAVTGVSGSGKSTLVNDILHRALARHFFGAADPPGRHDSIEGLEFLDKVVNIDQSPIGRTPRSNPATYTGIFTEVRALFSELPESKVRGYQPGRFSFNVKGGRCEACTGDGVVKIEMHFLPDVYVKCDVCGGKRFTRETLEITYKGKNISDVLEMTVDEAAEFFSSIPVLRRRLDVLQGVGLGYIHLGQPATTLSGGEAQRMKLSSELSKVATGRTLYILDEPTTGLHIHDVRQLLSVLDRLVERGNTVVVIEHNVDVIKSADHIIDLGPEGGEGGGRLVARGTPEEVAARPGSHTGETLRTALSTSGGERGPGRRSSGRVYSRP